MTPTAFINIGILAVPRCQFNRPTGVRCHSDGRVFVADRDSARIRIISKDFSTVTSLDPITDLLEPQKLVFTSGCQSIIILGSSNTFGQRANLLTEVSLSDASVVKIIGSGYRAHADGIGRNARFNLPSAIAWTSEGALLVGDLYDGNIRLIDWQTEQVQTLIFPEEASLRSLEGSPTGAFAYRPQQPRRGLGVSLAPYNQTNGLYASMTAAASRGSHQVKLIQWNAGATACTPCPAGLVARAGSISVKECSPFELPPSSTFPQTSALNATPTPTPTPSSSPPVPVPTTTPSPPDVLDAGTVSTVVTAISTAVVGSVVAGAVASAVASSTAGAAGSGSGSASAVAQVQMLSQVGRVGGSRRSQGLRSASCGFSWCVCVCARARERERARARD